MRNLLRWLRDCTVCPNFCRVDRTVSAGGRCRSGAGLTISSADLHFGEEPVLVGRGGSGTVFFTSCNLSCVYCQNYEISQLDYGTAVSAERFVSIVLGLQRRGAENINLVSPTHQAPRIFSALAAARKSGLSLPIVYNCGGYENPEFLRELDGLVDIYMPDMKYGSDEAAQKYSGVKEYVRWSRAALREMHRQVGDLAVNAAGTAVSGLLVRHLVLPGGISGSRAVIDFIAGEISPATYLNIMDQYRPCFRAREYRELAGRVPEQTIHEIAAYARSKGLTRVLY
jgi:putative pyruvate formate lyase activating enzyme